MTIARAAVVTRLNQIVRGVGVASAALGALVMAGWLLRSESIVRVWTEQPAMPFNTALAFLLSGIGLWSAADGDSALRLRLRLWVAACLLAIASLSLMVNVGGLDLRIGPASEASAGLQSGRIPVLPAVLFCLVAISLLAARSRRRAFNLLSQLLACVTSTVALWGVLDGLTGGTGELTGSAGSTALGLWMVTTSLLLLPSEHGLLRAISSASYGGSMLRRLLPAAIVVPLLAAYVSWHAEQVGWISGHTGIAIAVVTASAFVLLISIWTAHSIDSVDLQRARLLESLQVMVSSMREGVIACDSGGLITFFNPAAASILECSASEAAGQPLQRVFQLRNEHGGRVHDLVEQVLRERQAIVSTAEGVLVSKSGREVPTESSASPILDSAGLVSGVVVVFHDVADKRRAEEELRRLATIVESSDDAILSKSLDGVIVTWNKGAERLYGYSAEEAIGEPITIVVPPECRPGLAETLARCSRGEVVEHWQTSRMRKDGVLLCVSVTLSPLTDARGKIIAISEIVRDISERKRMEDELRQTNQRLSLAMRVGQSGGFDWNIRDDVNVWSPEMEELYGLAPGEFGGSRQEWESYLLPEDQAALSLAIERAFHTGEFAAEWRIRRCSDGQIRWVAARAKVLWDELGRPKRMIGFNTDITDRKHAEQEVRKLNSELEQRVAERTAALAASNKELEAFAYSVSHDLRAPLRHLDGFLSLIVKRAQSNLDEVSRRYLEKVVEASKRMGVLIDELLQFSRLGRTEIRKQTVDLNAIVRDLQQDAAAELRERNLVWKVEELPEVFADAAMLRRAMQNLILNAIKFTGACGQAEITIGRFCDEAGEDVIFVRDNGAGFDMQYRDKLFKVFQRLHGEDEFEGTGIGLANVKRIIERHGGKVWAEGAVGGGATFYFSLPQMSGDTGGRDECLESYLAG